MPLEDFFQSDDLRHRFETAGYSSLDELRNKGILQLAQDIELTEEEVVLVVSILNEGSDTLKPGISAAKLVKEPNHGITTSCRQLDQLFASPQGIPKGTITEISGAPGSGKTQFCIQLSLNVQRSMDQGGLGGECIYIDTEGGLIAERFHQVAQTNKDPEATHLKLQNIHHFRVLDHLELTALVRQLPNIFKEYINVKLLIIDSISYHLRLNIKDHRTRTGLLNSIGHNLIRIANKFNVPVVVTNHASPDMFTGIWRPSLGASWSQWCTDRIFLSRRRHQRYATMYSAYQQIPKPMVPFSITQTGIEDADEDTLARMNLLWSESELNMNEATLGQGNQSQESELGTEQHYILEINDPSPSLTVCNENSSWENKNQLTDKHITDETSKTNQEANDNRILVPDSQPDHSYEDLSNYYAIDPSANTMPRRRHLSLSQVSTTKRQRSVDDSNKHMTNNNFEVVYDSQDDSECDELFLSAFI